MKINLHKTFYSMSKYVLYGLAVQMLVFNFALAADVNGSMLVDEVNANEVDVTIKGVVTDENGDPLPGAAIIVSGTTTGTVTDIDGNYSITVPDNATLIFSYVGYSSQSVSLQGRSVINIQMAVDQSDLEEVVVTALGIEKSSRSIGYSATNVTSDEMSINRTPNFMNALQGKVAGVNISGMGTGPGGSSKIRIRGQSSISGQNSPLIVINGTPIDNTNFGARSGLGGSDSSIGPRGSSNFSDGGDGLSSINPDDIESMTVLKGAAASALYGSRAKDGVIMITTKTKGDNKGIGVTYNMNYTNETPLDFTDWQYEYGQGEAGIRPTTPFPASGQWSFGEKFAPGMTHSLYGLTNVPYEPQRNHFRDFYRNGQNMTNTITLASSGDKGGMSFSFSDLNSKGIVPNNTNNRKIMNFGFNYQLTEKFSFRGSINYSVEENKNPPNIANQDNTIPSSLGNLANSFPLDVLRDEGIDANGYEIVYSRFRNRTNPYFILEKQFQNVKRDRIFGNVSGTYKILPWLSVMGRISQDYWARDQDYNNFPHGHASLAAAPAGFENGQYTMDSRRFRELNTDFLVSANKAFGDFNVTANVGGNHMNRRMDTYGVTVTDFVVKDLYTVQNGRVKDPSYGVSEREVNSVFGSVDFAYKNRLFLSGTARNDWFSTLSAANRSILYPSVSTAYVFTEDLSTNGWLNFGKIRAAYAEVGSDADVGPYAGLLTYGVNANLFRGQPVGSFGGQVPNPNLKPMRVGEAEVGLDLKMFQGRVMLDVAAYRKITSDQIISATISNASGFGSTQINSGKSQNQGVEMLLTVVPIETANFTWESSFNGAYNISKVLSLLTDVEGEQIQVGSHSFNGLLRHVVGMEMGQVAGNGFRLDDQGNRIYGNNGVPLPTTTAINYGSALNRWVGGFNNSFNYKGLQFSFLIDFKLGGKMISGTNFNAVRHGKHKMTLEGREGGVVGEGVNLAGEPNTVAAPVQQYWEVVRSAGLVEPIVYDAGFWKLRQITMGYDFTKYLGPKAPIRGIRLNLVANNVLIIKKWVDNIDPESFGFTSDNISGMESHGVPTTRGLGFNLNVKF